MGAWMSGWCSLRIDVKSSVLKAVFEPDRRLDQAHMVKGLVTKWCTINKVVHYRGDAFAMLWMVGESSVQWGINMLIIWKGFRVCFFNGLTYKRFSHLWQIMCRKLTISTRKMAANQMLYGKIRLSKGLPGKNDCYRNPALDLWGSCRTCQTVWI